MDALLREAESALASLAAAEGDNTEVQKLLQRQAEASQKLSAFKEQLREQHTRRLVAAMRSVRTLPGHTAYVNGVVKVQRVETRTLWSYSLGDQTLKTWTHEVVE